MSEFFALLALCLQALVDEWEMDLADIHGIESYPNAFEDGWCMHVNGDRMAQLEIVHSKPDVRFSAFYSDFDYLFDPQEVQA